MIDRVTGNYQEAEKLLDYIMNNKINPGCLLFVLLCMQAQMKTQICCEIEGTLYGIKELDINKEKCHEV